MTVTFCKNRHSNKIGVVVQNLTCGVLVQTSKENHELWISGQYEVCARGKEEW